MAKINERGQTIMVLPILIKHSIPRIISLEEISLRVLNECLLVDKKGSEVIGKSEACGPIYKLKNEWPFQTFILTSINTLVRSYR